MLRKDEPLDGIPSRVCAPGRLRVPFLVYALFAVAMAGCFDPRTVSPSGVGGKGVGGTLGRGGGGGHPIPGGAGGKVGDDLDQDAGASEGGTGLTGAAGMTGAGGENGTGGMTASGGVPGAGGATGTGGAAGSGGSGTGPGGTSGTGGTSAAGGTPGTGGASSGGTGGCAGTTTGNRCGTCGPVCDGATPFCDASGPTPTCTANPAAPLNGLRWEVPCGATKESSPELCFNFPAGKTECPETPTPGHYPVNKRVTFGGRPGVFYDVTIRFYGIVEPKVFTGGTASSDRFRVGGTATATNYNPYSLQVAGPTRPELNQIYHLNDAGADGETRVVYPIDYTKTLRIEGGSMVTLTSYDPDCTIVRNCRMPNAANCMPYSVAGSAFNGQFVQMTVMSIAMVPAGR